MPVLTDTHKNILLSIGLLLTAIILHYSSVSYMRNAINDKFVNLRSADTIFQNTSQSLVTETPANLKYLKTQYEASQKIKNYYLDVASTYYRNYYAFSICAIVFITILAIASFLLINTGWQTATPIIRTFFLTTTLISSFYFFLPMVLDNRENYALNLRKARTFNQIQMNILSFSTKLYMSRPDSLSSFLGKSFEDIANNFDLETVEIHSEKLGDNPENLLKSANPGSSK